MKKLFIFILIITFAFSLGCHVVHASELTEVPEEKVTTPKHDADDEKATLFTRLYEAFAENKTDVFTVGGSTILFILSIILKRDLGYTSKHIVENISRVLAKTDISEEKQNAIVNGLNEMVDGYDEIREQSENVKKKMDDVISQVEKITVSNASLETKIDELFGVIITLLDKEIIQNAEVMEVLTTVYSNNSAVSKGVKDFVALKNAENAKIVNEAALIVGKAAGSNEH